jgi:methyl halide transferase
MSQVVDWEAKYREGRTGWQRPGVNPALAAWCESGALKPCRILMPGAGRSAEPAFLAQAGFDVTVVDLAPSAVAFQQAELAATGGQVILADLLEWQPERLFDAIYDQTCLCALPPELWEAYARRLAGWLHPGGVLAALFMQTGGAGGPPFHCSLARMHELFPAAEWSWPETLPPEVPHPAGFREQPALLRRQ